jgi:hypothetical protein
MTYFEASDWHFATAEGAGVRSRRLRNAAGVAMVSFFFFALVAAFAFEMAMPFMVVSLLCWVIFGTAAKRSGRPQPLRAQPLSRAASGR